MLASVHIWAQGSGPDAPAPVPVEKAESSIYWGGLTRESLLFLGVKHGFRWMTEPGTRNMKGPFFQGYRDSIAGLHGWSDGDPFYVNYVGHPMQGAISGYIWAHNDRRYRTVEFGMNRDYWRSRLRAGAFAFAYSSQFEIGPISEATIGYIQSKPPAQGLVDHVVTPTLGVGWMVAEDALDRFVIRPFEDRVRNPYARMLVRGWLNPARSFANMMAFRAPWDRDTRRGTWTYDPLLHVAPRRAPKPIEEYPAVAPFEIAATGMVTEVDGRTCTGGGSAAAYRFAPSWQGVFDVAGCQVPGGDALFYRIGPRWSPAPDKLWSPYAEVLVGGRKVTYESQGREWNEFSATAAAGVDLRITRALAFRVASVGYQGGAVQFSSGIVLRMGNW
jgi:hypothetical protein